MIPSTNAAAPKTQPPPAPKADTKPVDQKPAGQAPAQQTQAQAPAAPAQNDTFDAQAKQPQATQRNQGDTFDQKSGGGGGLGDMLLGAAKSVVEPVANAVAPVVKPIADAVAPVVAPVANAVGSVMGPIGEAVGGAIGGFMGRVEDIWGKQDVIAKLADIGQPGVLQDAVNPPDKNN